MREQFCQATSNVNNMYVNNGTPFRMLQLIQMYEYIVCAVRIDETVRKCIAENKRYPRMH